MDLATVTWLASPAGRAALALVPAYEDRAAVGLVARLRRDGLRAEQASALVTQAQLRARAVAKFGEQASRTLFTPDGLEQASRAEVAAAHAARFAAAGVRLVHDLGCGIGADAMAFAAAGVDVAAIDADPVTAAVAAANLRPWPGSSGRVGRVEEVDLAPLGVDRVGAWLDPARRASGIRDARGRARRVTGLEQLSPPWTRVLAVADALPATGAKLAPSFPHEQIPPGAEAQWVSWGGDVVECAIWWGPLAGGVTRSALVLRPGRPAVSVNERDAPEPAPVARSLGAVGGYLYECDKAVVQARLTAVATTATAGLELQRGVGYVASDTDCELGSARRYRVIEAMPFHAKAVRGWLRARGITGLTIKQRGAGLAEDAVRRSLGVGRGAGTGGQAVLVLTPVAGKLAAIVVEPA